MARARSPNRDKAFELWKNSNGKMLLKDIAEQLGVSDSQVRKWKNQDQWDHKLKGNVTKKISNVTKKCGGQPGNKNAVGNRGGKGGPVGNKNAVKHGFFSKYIPQETLEIMGMLEEQNPVDLIWDQICIVYASIIRSQQIMFVTDQDDIKKEIKKEKWGEEASETEWELQFAWDRQATFLNAQSRAQSEFRSLVKQFVEMAHLDDERRLKLEQMKLGIEKTKVEVEILLKDTENTPTQLVVKRWSNDNS